MADIAALVALGANLGDPAAQVRRAVTELACLPDTRLTACSSLYLSKPVGFLQQPDYVNAVAALSTKLTPRSLLAGLLEIESRHGRRRDFKNAPRTLDLDLLLYDGLVMHEPGLTLPHPRMLERSFVLVPLAEIAPDCIIPGQGSVREHLAHLHMQGLTRLPEAPLQASLANS
jgi:2-amino-4-hydroxy-6-hydroxymethyldihydropteridine diphosphokinase